VVHQPPFPRPSGPFALSFVLSAALAAGCGSSSPPLQEDDGTGGDDAATSTGSQGTGTGGEDVGEEPFTPSPGGVRRLLPHQLKSSVAVVLGAAAAETVVDVPQIEPLHGFASIGAAEIAVSATDIGELERIATNAAAAAVASPDTLIALAPCVGDDSPSEACFVDVARDVGFVAWRRPLEDAEIDRLVAIAAAGSAWSVDNGVGVPFEQGVKYLLMAMLQSPHFLYIVEIGTPDPEDSTRRVLGPYEMAARLAFFLQGRTPPRALLQDAAGGLLSTPDGIRQAARELLQSDHAKVALDAFYAEMFYLDDLANLSKDPDLFPEFDGEVAASMREETRLFMRDLVWDREADAREMFTSRASFVDADLAALYGVEGGAEGTFARVELPEGHQRAGLLGHASFLARFAHPGVTSPTRRGHYINARFLCDEIPPPPPGVVPVLPEDPGVPETMREKLERHQTDPSCRGCHVVTDPPGLAFEHFDAIGQWREQDRGLDIDISGTSERLGSYSGPVELGQLIADDERMPTCVVQNFVRSSMGHLEGSGERYAVRDLSEDFSGGGYKIKDLMVELTASKLFRYVGEPK
jgi:hypothetical protein